MSDSADGLVSSYESKDYAKSSSGRYGAYNSKRTRSPSYDGDSRDKDYERSRDRDSDRYRDQDVRSRLSPG